MRYGSMLVLCALAVGCSKKEPTAPTAPETAPAEAPAEGATGEAGQKQAETPAEKPVETPAEKPAAIGGTMPAALAALSADHTVTVGGFEGLDGLARQVSATMDGLPDNLKAEMREALPEGFDTIVQKMGFDPRDAAAWSAVGLDPAPGVSVAIDLRMRLKDGPPLPVALARVTDRGKLVAALKRLDPVFDLALPETDGVARLTTPEGDALLGTRGGFTAVMPVAAGVDAAEARKLFADWLKAADPPLAEAAGLAPALELPGDARAYGAVITPALLQVAPQPLPQVFVDYYTARFPALSMAVGADLKSGRLRIQADAPAVKALRQILVPEAAAPALDRFAPKDGLAVGFSIDPARIFDGIVALIPPERGDVQGQVLIGKNAVPVLFGVSLEDLAAALSGHGAMLTTPAGLTAAGEKPIVVALGVADVEVMDRILPVALDRLAAQSGGARKPTKFGALDGHVLETGDQPTFAVRSGDAVLFGPSRTAIEEALARAEKPVEGRPRLSFADGTFYAASVSMALFDTLVADAPPDATEMIAAARAFWSKRFGATLTMDLRVDAHGIVSEGPAAAMLIGATTAVAIPAFMKYINRSKAAMARVQLGQLFAAASLASLEGKALAAAPLTPAADPCADGAGEFEATVETWSHPTWQALGFAPVGKLYYRYAFEPGPGQGFTIRAVGDLDCDGVQAVYEQSADAEGQRRPDVEQNPLE